MPKLLIINGHDTYESSPGHLNQTMVEVMREELKDKFEIQISVLKDGYETACYNVVKNPQIETFKENLRRHLRQIFG